MNKLHLSIISFMLLISTSMTAWGDIPPPPVNQNLGIPDTQFNLLSKEICWRCHKPAALGETSPPAGVPVKTTYLPDRHHQHVNTEIAGGPEQPPFMDANRDGVEDTHYTCLNCHELGAGSSGQLELVQSFRDCLFCHIVEGGERTVHHDTPLAKEALCGTCHGSLIRSLDMGMPPASYQPSIITPWRSGKPNGDDSLTSSAGTHPGNCNYCHNTREGNSDGLGTPDVPSGFGPITVFTNMENHHGTGVPTITDSSKGSPCSWCHNIDQPPEEGIRGCQRCHDIESLHNIEYDADGDGIIPGSETAFNGHIGNTDNCWGCHGNNREISSMSGGFSPATATPAQLTNMNLSTWKEGTEFQMTLTGSGFINQGGLLNEQTFRPTVQLTDSAGSTIELTPTAESVDSVEVAIPSLPADNYWVQIKKGTTLSNPLVASVTPAIGVRSAICYSRFNLVILTGTGLSQFLPGEGTGTSITGDGTEAFRVFRWSGGMIAAMFTSCPTAVEVTNIFDAITINPRRY